MQAARRKGNMMRGTRTRRSPRGKRLPPPPERLVRWMACSTWWHSQSEAANCTQCRLDGGRVARNAIARVTPDDVAYYVALPFDERLNGGWRRKGRAVLELMEAPPSEAESRRQAAGAEPSTTTPAARLPVSSQLCWISGGRRSGRRRSGRLPERKRSSCARRSALAEAAHCSWRSPSRPRWLGRFGPWPPGRWIIGTQRRQ